MSGKTWTTGEATRLWVMSISAGRHSPEKIKAMINHFRTPGATVFAITEGDGPLHVSKPFARKIRNFVADGALDWVMDETPGRPKRGYDSEWRAWLLSHAAQFSVAVDVYRQDLAVQIQTREIRLGRRSGFMPAKIPYGPPHRPFVESIFIRNSELGKLRGEFESALKAEDIGEARALSEKIGLKLGDRIAI